MRGCGIAGMALCGALVVSLSAPARADYVPKRIGSLMGALPCVSPLE
jgi:hypothetical protein